MSRYFQVGDQVLWNPSNGVAELFVSTANALASAAGVPTGIGPMEGGRGVPALDESASTGLPDVSVGPTSMAAPGDAGRLRRLGEEHDRAMPY